MSGLPPAVIRERVCADLAVIDAAQARLRGLSTDLVGNAFRIEVAGRLETQERVTRGLSYRLFGQLADPPDGPDDPGPPAGVKVIDVLRSRLRITTAEVRRRMTMAARITERRSLTGPPRPPELPVLAAAVRPGHHVQGSDQPVVAAGADTRSTSQRLHDALEWGLGAAMASGRLGTHRGLPVTIIASTTLAELEQAAAAAADPSLPMPAPARTGGGSVLPMRDLISLAAAGGAIHYLAVFENHFARPLYLGRSRRLASPDQRILCHARDHGCTHPNCPEPGYHSDVHHALDWADGGPTDADNLYFACGPANRAAAEGTYTTHITDQGRLAWTDGTGPPEVNDYTTPKNSSPTTNHPTTTTPEPVGARTLHHTLMPLQGSHEFHSAADEFADSPPVASPGAYLLSYPATPASARYSADHTGLPQLGVRDAHQDRRRGASSWRRSATTTGTDAADHRGPARCRIPAAGAGSRTTLNA